MLLTPATIFLSKNPPTFSETPRPWLPMPFPPIFFEFFWLPEPRFWLNSGKPTKEKILGTCANFHWSAGRLFSPTRPIREPIPRTVTKPTKKSEHSGPEQPVQFFCAFFSGYVFLGGIACLIIIIMSINTTKLKKINNNK